MHVGKTNIHKINIQKIKYPYERSTAVVCGNKQKIDLNYTDLNFHIKTI